MMEKLLQLIEKTKGSVSIEINPHRNYYQSIKEHIQGYPDGYLDDQFIEKEIVAEMEKQDRLIIIQFYPTTPVGFHTVAHYDLEKAVDEALKTFN